VDAVHLMTDIYGRSLMMQRFGATVTGLLLLTGATAGCTEDRQPDRGNSSSPAPSLRAPSQDARSTADARAIAAYRGMWNAYAAAGEVADPTHGDVAQYATGDALESLTGALDGYRKKGQVMKGRPALTPRVVSRSPGDPVSRLEVKDCADTTTWLVYDKSGDLINDVPGGRRSIGATVIDTGNGVWKVSLFGAREVGTC
jgi:hypothetical protein